MAWMLDVHLYFTGFFCVCMCGGCPWIMEVWCQLSANNIGERHSLLLNQHNGDDAPQE